MSQAAGIMLAFRGSESGQAQIKGRPLVDGGERSAGIRGRWVEQRSGHPNAIGLEAVSARR